VNLCCVFLTLDGDAKRIHGGLSWFGQKKTLRLVRRGGYCISLHLSACVGVTSHERGNRSQVSEKEYNGVLLEMFISKVWEVLVLFFFYPLVSVVSPFFPPFDEDMAPSDMNNDYKVRWFLHLYSVFGYNSLGSTCTCHYLIVGSNVFHNGSSSKLNFRFIGSPRVPHWEGHNSSIRSAIEVNEHLMERLFDKLSNRSDLILISHRQGLQISNILCRYFWRELHYRHRLVRHPWDLGPSWSTPQEHREHLRDRLGCPPPWAPP
jgi:hypothetical protein